MGITSVKSVHAQAGLVCPSVVDGSDYVNGSTISVARIVINLGNKGPTCSGSPGAQINFPSATSTSSVAVFLNTFGSGSFGGGTFLSIIYGGSVSGLTFNGSQFNSGASVAVTRAASLSAAVEFDIGGSRFEFAVKKNASSDTLNGFTITEVDIKPPTLSLITAVPTPTNDNTPEFVLRSDEDGTLSVGGSCGTSVPAITANSNTSVA
ncbi:MAG: hypothetical protein AAFV69_13520, partial [Pseudomonadota bacterium]